MGAGSPCRAGNCTGIDTRCNTQQNHKMYERHGFTKAGQPRLYRIWRAMRQRCYDPKNDGYARYGGRGITVCPDWNQSFVKFKEWAEANGYAEHLSIDRKENDGPYSPANCRWASSATQMANQGRSCLVTIKDKTKTVKEWANATGIPFSTLYKRYHRGVRGAAMIAKPRAVTKGASL